MTRRSSPRLLLRLGALAALAALLAACGQTGALYLPDRDGEPVAADGASAPAQAAPARSEDTHRKIH